VTSDVRSTADIDVISEQLQQVRDDCEEKVAESEEKIADLEERLAEAAATQEATEDEARARLGEMIERMEEMKRSVAKAEVETDLKRETSRKLKEEVIDNDRLTVANLNRIKALEAQLGEQLETIEQLEQQNEELRARDESDASEVEALKEILDDRERKLVQLSHRLEVREAMSEMNNNSGRIDARIDARDTPTKRDSLLERIGKGTSFGSLI